MKQEYKILNFEGGTNNKFDPRDIAENQNAYSQFSVNKVGRLVKEGDAKNLYNKTGINNHGITDITLTSGGFEKGYGLFAFSHDYNMDSTPVEADTEYIVTNDANAIDIYDPNRGAGADFIHDKFTLGSRNTTVKPEYYNVDGALRASDSNFEILTTGETVDMAGDVSITKNDVDLVHTSGTIPTGSIIQIDQELMYVTSGSSTSTDIKVIRGFANTKITTHAHNTEIYYANVPKYFGHIKEDRLFECATSNSINTWVEDIQTPQPPNNTRKSDGTTGTLASSAGIQSLRIYDKVTSSTTNIPTESEKVVMEFGESPGNLGITKILFGSYGDGNIKITTSGYGSDSTANHRLEVGDVVNFSEMQGVASSLSGEHEVMSIVGDTSFTIYVEGASNATDLDYIPASGEGATTGDREAFSSSVSDWSDHSDENQAVDGLKITIGGDDDFTNESSFPIHITGETGVTNYNGIYMAFRIDDNNAYISHAEHDSHASGSTDAKVQQLIGIIRPEGFGVINPDLKRKWNFAMSFKYDGPGQEVQESLLTMGHKIEEAVKNDDTPNNLNESSNLNDSATAIQVLDSSTFSVDDVIMIGTEQMLVKEINPSSEASHLLVERGYNNTTKAAHNDGVPIFKITELTPTATVDWTNFVGVPKCVIKSVYNYGVDEKSWNARINGFKIYMKDVTEEDASKEFRLFAEVNFSKGTYTLFGAGDSELILEQPATSAIATVTTGTDITIKPIDTYLSENLFTEQTIIDAQYKASCVAGRKVYIGNIRQGGRTYPDRMLRTPINKFDTFPETNFIDVAIGDGDSITVLESFGDRLLQYKKNHLYVINIAGESEVLEAEYPNAGVAKPSQVVKTNSGIVWFNPSGLWFFDGQQAINLTRQVEANNYPDHTTETGIIGFDNVANRVVYAPRISSGQQSAWYIYNLELQAYQSYTDGSMFPTGTANHYTNIINDSNGNMIIGYVDSAENQEMNFFQWNSSAGEGQSTAFTNMFKSKDIDFGSPTINKKIYKVYVTYKCTGHSGIQMKYATNGSGSFTGTFSSSKSTNYNADSFTSNGTETGFKNTDGDWKVAELKPSSSINNIKSIQFSFDHLTIDGGTAQGGSSTTIQLDTSGNSTDADAFNDYNIYVYDGPARYNTSKITGYAADRTATVATMTDKGYGNAATSASKYILGAIATDFEINDITVIFRPKRVK